MTSSKGSVACPGENCPEWLWCEKGMMETKNTAGKSVVDNSVGTQRIAGLDILLTRDFMKH